MPRLFMQWEGSTEARQIDLCGNCILSVEKILSATVPVENRGVGRKPKATNGVVLSDPPTKKRGPYKKKGRQATLGDFPCPTCDRVFQSNYARAGHMAVHGR